jgi:hypothetical protein
MRKPVTTRVVKTRVVKTRIVKVLAQVDDGDVAPA